MYKNEIKRFVWNIYYIGLQMSTLVEWEIFCCFPNEDFFQLYHGESKLHFDVCFVLGQHA